MLELARAISQSTDGTKSGIVFFFNTGEEEGLHGSYSFVTQHPWMKDIRFAIDLEARGIGGKSSIFQTGTDPWAIENYARTAKRPSAQVIFQDLFVSGVVASATDFQVYQQIGGLSGLDFAFSDMSGVYHTKNDKIELLKPGSLQHLGDNLLSFLLQTPASSDFSLGEAKERTEQDRAIYFDILGKYLIVYRQHFVSVIQNAVISLSFLVLTISLFLGGYQAVVALAISFLAIILMWILSLSLSVAVAFLLPHICTYPAPYLAYQWLVLGLFGAPAVLGALTGQLFGFRILNKYLGQVALKNDSSSIKLEAERWLYKAGLIQSLIILILWSFVKAGSSYIAVVWLIFPALAYGLIEATLTPTAPRPLRITTLLFALCTPVLITGGLFVRLGISVIESLLSFDINPGSKSDWSGNLLVAIYTAAVVCLTLVYLLSYIHNSGDKKLLIISMWIVFSLSLAAVSYGILPTFTNDLNRIVNVVHVVDTNGSNGEDAEPVSYVSIYSPTPGKITNELNNLQEEEFSCGTNQTIDFITFTASYSCQSTTGTGDGWSKADIPILRVKGDSVARIRKTEVSIDTKNSTRWTLAINSKLIEKYTLTAAMEEDTFLVDNNSEGESWDIVQFAGGTGGAGGAPTKFRLTLFWARSSEETLKQEASPLLKLRTDFNRITPKVQKVFKGLPEWCSQAGKSLNPLNLAFMTSLPADF